MSREIDPRFPPEQRRVSSKQIRWVVIGNLPENTRAEFWQRAKAIAPEIITLRREGGKLFGKFNAVFQIPETRYRQIMEANYDS